MWKLVRKEEAKLFAGLPKRFKVITDPRLGPELMGADRLSDLNHDYIATMINEKHTGMRIEADKKIMILLKHMDSWAVYAVDMGKKFYLVMDPVETEEPRHDVEAKHRRNAIRVLSNLRRCIHECILGARISSAGWALDYNTAMHTCYERYVASFRTALATKTLNPTISCVLIRTRRRAGFMRCTTFENTQARSFRA